MGCLVKISTVEYKFFFWSLVFIKDFCFSNEPPTKEELMRNLAIMDMKKDNAAKIDKKFAKAITKENPEKIVTGMSFPSYKDYERVPGKKPDE